MIVIDSIVAAKVTRRRVCDAFAVARLLIVGISLGGYVVYKLAGERAGSWATGVLGGLISSTATTVSLARRSRAAATSERGMASLF